jgi:hypothetical protein
MANDEYYTPKKYIELVYKIFGSIGLDPASCAIANRTVQADRYFDLQQNGLKQDWLAGNVFLNFPYSNSDAWINKALYEYQTKHYDNIIMLCNSITDTQAFHKLINQDIDRLPLFDDGYQQCRLDSYLSICFVKGRINFIAPDGSEQSNPFYPSMFTCLTCNYDIDQKFIKYFSAIGSVVKLVK